MTLPDIIQDIHALETKLIQLEKRYNLRSADFYHLYKAGELEQSREFIRWVGYYEAKIDREMQYQELYSGQDEKRRFSSSWKGSRSDSDAQPFLTPSRKMAQR